MASLYLCDFILALRVFFKILKAIKSIGNFILVSIMLGYSIAMSSSIIEQGFNLMLFGMGTVFVFLTILIFATNGMSKLITHFFPEKIVAAAPPKRKDQRHWEQLLSLQLH